MDFDGLAASTTYSVDTSLVGDLLPQQLDLLENTNFIVFKNLNLFSLKFVANF